MLADLERARHPASSLSRLRCRGRDHCEGSGSRRGLQHGCRAPRRGSECRKSLQAPGLRCVRARGRGGQNIFEQINTEGHVLYLHHDQQDSTRLITGESGKTEATATYGAYGELTGSTGTATTPLGYDGQLTSSETGLIYLRAREYDPKTAQFLSVDPAVSVTRSPYNYAGDNPVNRVDLSGLEAIPVPVVGPEDAGLCADPVTAAACVGAGGYAAVEAGKSIVNAWAGEESGNDEGEAELHAKEAERESEQGCGNTPPGYDSETWTKGPASRPSDPGENFYDPEGGEWRWHAPDKYHPEGHWDYKGPGSSAPWENIYP